MGTTTENAYNRRIGLLLSRYGTSERNVMRILGIRQFGARGTGIKVGISLMERSFLPDRASRMAWAEWKMSIARAYRDRELPE